MGAGLLAVKSGFILFNKNYQFPLQINTLEREREMVSLVWKTGSRFVECFTKVNGCDFDVYCPLFPVVLNFHN
jgi:hypothetical protein